MSRGIGAATVVATVGVLVAVAGCERSHVGDISVIRESGELRIIVPRMARDRRLPREGHPFDLERELAVDFARAHDLEPRFVQVGDHDDLIPALVEGRGDIIAAALTVTPERRERIAFSSPIGRVTEQVVTRVGDSSVTGPEFLAGRTLALRSSSSYWETAERLARQHPELSLQPVSEQLHTEEILYRVQRGDFDMTMADDNLVAHALRYMPDLRVAFEMDEEHSTAFGIRSDASELKAAIDSHLQRAQLHLGEAARYTGDLDVIRERGVLRVLTRNSAATYFIWRGQLMGFEYDLARRFAERLGVRLEVIVPPSRADLIPWLQQGRGDVVAAGLTTTEERSSGSISFAEPYNFVVEQIVTRAGEEGLNSPVDLAGRTVVVRRRSGYWSTAQNLLEQGIEFELVAAPEALETETIIDLVASGDYDLTIADSHILDIELTWRDDIVGAFTVGDTAEHAWAVRGDDAELKRAIDRFVRDEYRGRWYNITYNKYFRTAHRIEERALERPSRTGRISPFDELFRRYAERFGFDWRLIAAQAYEESRFDPNAVSSVGAVGIMQVMPSTAGPMGIDNPEEPESGVLAGTKYLRHQYDLFDDVATEADRIWFALASYNAGYGHVTDARRLASERGHDPDRWFREVARVMPLLARREYHRNTRYGYCRCQEPVNYVRRIRQKHRAYLEVTMAAGN